MNSSILFFIFLQQSEKFLFKSEKVFTVLTVMLIIWIGFLAHTFWIQRKISNLEKELKEGE